MSRFQLIAGFVLVDDKILVNLQTLTQVDFTGTKIIFWQQTISGSSYALISSSETVNATSEDWQAFLTVLKDKQ